MSATACASRVCPTVSFSENRQIGGGCIGGLIWPCKVGSEKDCGITSTAYGSETAAGKVMPTKLKHLRAQAIEPLQSSGAQQDMSA